jgi:hypothetical protein
MKRTLVCLAILLAAVTAAPNAEAKKKTAKEGLQELHDLIGSWKCTGNPLVGSKEEQREKFWQEKISWKWQFKEKDVFLSANLTQGKYYFKFVIRYLPDKETYQLEATTADKKTRTFTGKLDRKTLTFERTDEKTKQGERLVFQMLHHNRYLIVYEERPADSKSFTKLYRVGSTKEGVPFASVDKGPECIVSGGLGTMPVTHKGKTYYVCCSGCRDAFREDPEKYIKEYEEAKKKKKD